jgi:hypothetical protein
MEIEEENKVTKIPEKLKDLLESSDLELVNLGVTLAENDKVPWRDIVYYIPMWSYSMIYHHKLTDTIIVKEYSRTTSSTTTMRTDDSMYERVYGKLVVHYE